MRALLLDLDGVLRLWPAERDRELEVRYGVQVARVRAVELVDEWQRHCGVLNSAVMAVVRAVRRRGVGVVVVTNGTDRVRSDLAELGVLGELDGVVNSWEIGVRKPAPDIYLAAARAARVAAGDCLFVDDTAGHVAAARAVGTRAVHFTGDVTVLQAALQA